MRATRSPHTFTCPPKLSEVDTSIFPETIVSPSVNITLPSALISIDVACLLSPPVNNFGKSTVSI